MVHGPAVLLEHPADRAEVLSEFGPPHMLEHAHGADLVEDPFLGNVAVVLEADLHLVGDPFPFHALPGIGELLLAEGHAHTPWIP